MIKKEHDEKSLGQIAYEAEPKEVQQDFGLWKNAPTLVRKIHEATARVVIVSFLSKTVREYQKNLSADERHDLWSALSEGYCKECGGTDLPCYCEHDD